MTHSNRFARAVEETASLAAVGPRPSPAPVSPSPAVVPIGEPYAGDEKLAAALGSSPALTPDPGPVLTPRPEWATDRLSEDAATLHSLACACDWGGDVEGHGVDFEDLAAAWEKRALARLLAAGTVVRAEDVPVRYPVEAKVSAGAWGSLAAGIGLALANLLLARLDMIPSLLGGDSPWAGALVLVLGAALPAVIGTLRAYGAPHTPRPAVRAPSAPQEGAAAAGA